MPVSKRQHVIDSAKELFEREGFHATGIERILEHANVAKMTLYNNFGSKDALIVAVLEQSSRTMVEHLVTIAQQAGSDPYEQILGIFGALGDWYDDPAFCGCIFQAATAEYPDPDCEIAQAARAHQIRLTDLFRDLCTKAELRDPDALARRLALLASGATCVARQTRERLPADDALRMAEILLERASTPIEHRAL
jgi:AcrR family transcriptional regulator